MTPTRRKPHTVRVETIDQIATREDRARRSRESAELQRRFDLSKRLGERAMAGERFGLKGFMAIGFPILTPESAEYQDMVEACSEVQRIAAGKCIYIASFRPGVVGIKADSGEDGVAFSVKPVASGAYHIHAEVLLSRALHEKDIPAESMMYGSDEQPYAVSFIEGNQGVALVKAVREITLARDSAEGYDQFEEGIMALTEDYTRCLIDQSI